MGSYRLFVVLGVVAAVGYSNGDVNDIPCQEPEGTSSGPTKICINKPPNYSSLEEKMKEALEKNKGLYALRSGYFEEKDEQDDLGDEDNCMLETQWETPFIIVKNVSEGIPFSVVQTDSFEQRIKVTRCKNLYKPCFETIISSAGDSRKTSCEQQIGSVSIYIYNHGNEQIEAYPFDLPTNCYCKIQIQDYSL